MMQATMDAVQEMQQVLVSSANAYDYDKSKNITPACARQVENTNGNTKATTTTVVSPPSDLAHDKSTVTCNISCIAILIPIPPYNAAQDKDNYNYAEALVKRGHVAKEDSYSQGGCGSCLGLELMGCLLTCTKQFRTLRPGEHETKQHVTTQHISLAMDTIQLFGRQKQVVSGGSSLSSRSHQQRQKHTGSQSVLRRLDILTLSGLPQGTGGRGAKDTKFVEIKYDASDMVHHDHDHDTNTHTNQNCHLLDQDSAFHHFPMVRPIALVKAPQEMMDEASGDAKNASTSKHTNTSTAVRGEDPQLAMVKHAEACDFVVEVCVPLLVLDVTVSERNALVGIVQSLIPPTSASSTSEGTGNANAPTDTNTVHQERAESRISESKKIGGSAPMAVAVSCHRAMLYLHEGEGEQQGSSSSSASSTSTSSFVVVADGVKIHSVLRSSPDGGTGLSQCRCLAHAFALYSANKRRRTPSSLSPTRQQHAIKKYHEQEQQQSATIGIILL
jgi:hypothetical protein